MAKTKQGASAWLNAKLIYAKRYYIPAALLTLLSAGCFVFFCAFLARFSSDWLLLDVFQPLRLVYGLLFLAGRYALAHGATYLNNKAGSTIVETIKTETYSKLLSQNQFDSTASTLYVTSMADHLKPYFSSFVPNGVASVLVGIALLVVSFVAETWVGIILLISFVVIPMQMIVIGIGAESMHKKHINLFVRYASVFYNRLQTVGEIVNLDNYAVQYDFLKEKGEKVNEASAKVMRIAILSSAVLELFVTLCIAVVAIYLGMSLLGIMPGKNYGKGYDFETALFLLTLAPYFFFYLRKFVSGYHDKNRALASAQVIMPILNEPSRHVINQSELPQSFTHIDVNQLDFAYPQSPLKVLNHISVSLPQKGVVLVKGISGSGKSTLLKLLSGNLSPQGGRISVDNLSAEESSSWLYHHTAYMNQFPFLFDGSIIYNVTLNNTDEVPTTYPLFLDKLINKKADGWHTRLTNNGRELSGGERQLITLARLLMNPREVILLDEPTSNLDTYTTDIIVSEVEALAQRHLVVVASHDPKFEQIASQSIQLNWGEQLATYD